MDGLEIGTPVIIEEITFVPILKKEIPKEDRDYITLSEAIAEGLCKIIDKGTEVSHILFINLGEIPILVEEGEIFLGHGTQDRICVGTVLVQPGEQVEIPVKCVHAPHHLQSGAAFGYGGKCSRKMLNELRTMKYLSAAGRTPVSRISQSRVWMKVREETELEHGITDPTQYTQAVRLRRQKAKRRSVQLKLPDNTIGIVVVGADGNVKAMEIHRSPHNFKVRKEGLLESLEHADIWKKTGKGPFPKAQEKAKALFKGLSEIEEGKEALQQVEIEGLVVNLSGISGEVLTTKFYSTICPKCNKPKMRQKVCPHCGFKEEVLEELAFMSMA